MTHPYARPEHTAELPTSDYLFGAIWPVDERDNAPDWEIISNARADLPAVARRHGADIPSLDAAVITIRPGAGFPGSGGAARVAHAVVPATPRERPADRTPGLPKRKPRPKLSAREKTAQALEELRILAGYQNSPAYQAAQGHAAAA